MLAQLALCLLPLALGSPVAKRDTGVLIQSQKDGLCLSYGSPGDGTPVFSTACSGAMTWDIDYGSGSVLASGTNFALDAGSNPTNHESMKLWTSYPGLYQQTWYYTGTDYIAITGGTQCLDEGDYGNKVQLYTCQSNNVNQQWSILASASTAPSSTIATPSATMPSPSPSASTGSGGGGFNTPRQIHPNGDTSQCLTVQGGSLTVGASVAISDCFHVSSQYAPLQMWNLEGSGRGPITIGNGLCLDAGDSESPYQIVSYDFSTVKVWTCYAGLFQQQWFQGGPTFSLAHDNLCLDVKLGSQPMAASPYGSQADVQVYECTQGDSQQVWTY